MTLREFSLTSSAPARFTYPVTYFFQKLKPCVLAINVLYLGDTKTKHFFMQETKFGPFKVILLIFTKHLHMISFNNVRIFKCDVLQIINLLIKARSSNCILKRRNNDVLPPAKQNFYFSNIQFKNTRAQEIPYPTFLKKETT